MSFTCLDDPRRPAALALALALALAPGAARAQDDADGEQPPGSIDAIDAEFARKLRELEADRLRQIAALVQRSEGAAATSALETYLRGVIGAGLFEQGEPVAERVLSDGAPSTVSRYLAEVVNILGEAERGAFEESLESIVRASTAAEAETEQDGEAARQALSPASRMALLDTYYQRLVQAGQFEVARRAFQQIASSQKDGAEPAIASYLANRIGQLDMIGRPAPAFGGHDVDGHFIRLEDAAGETVLLVFWATWHRPGAEQIAWMKQEYARYQSKGLKIIGVNLDAMAGGGRPMAEVLPDVRRYILEYSIPWPNIVNAPGEGDIASAFGVTEIPANVLIGQDGRIVNLDLNVANFSDAIDAALAQ